MILARRRPRGGSGALAAQRLDIRPAGPAGYPASRTGQVSGRPAGYIQICRFLSNFTKLSQYLTKFNEHL